MFFRHGGHGHVVANFYSQAMNKRTDEYGWDNAENRCRFANELIDAVRERIGTEMRYRMADQRRRTDPRRGRCRRRLACQINSA